MSQTPKSKQGEAKPTQAGVLIVDNQPVVRERVVQLVEAEPDLMVCGETDDAATAMRLIAESRPKLVIAGLSLKNSHGLDFVKNLHSANAQLLILVFSMYDEMTYAERVIRAGARGFISKQEPTKELVRAIRLALQGEVYLSERVAVSKVTRFFGRSPAQAGSPIEKLSDRELQVLQLIGDGQSTSQIARALHLDGKTIETYRARIKVKLKLGTAAQLGQYARDWREGPVLAL